MANPASNMIGVVEELWRSPIKSTMGEQLTAAEVAENGLLGDRADALRDTSDGKIAIAKNPRKWPNLFDYGAAPTGAATGGREAAARSNHDVPPHAEAGGGELARCGINSTAGLAGLFDPADK